jgi:short-subunit dehydrogenase
MKKCFLITGGTGFIGKNLCEFLIKKKHRVYVITKKEDQYLKNIGVNFINSNYEDIKKTNFLPDNFDVVIHCSANPVFGDGKNYYVDNFTKTKNFFNFFVNSKVRFIFISSIGAVDRSRQDNCAKILDENSERNPTTDYGKTKLLAEELLNNSKLQTILIRPSLVIGEQMRPNSHFAVFAKKILKKKLFSFFDWSGKISIIDVRDLVNAIYFLSIKKLNKKNVLFFCSGQTISIKNFIRSVDVKLGFIPISDFLKKINTLIFKIPFILKILTLPALVASDKKLQKLGWKKKFNAITTLKKVVQREKYLLDPENFSPPTGVTLITGGGSGLGREFLSRLVKKRDKILVIDKNIRAIKSYSKKFPNKIKLIKFDLSNLNALNKLIYEGLLKKYKISEVIFCAGMGYRKNIFDADLSIHYKIFNTNVLSTLAILSKVYADMKNLNYGHIIFINSSASFQPLPGIASYSSSKVALKFLSDCMVAENENPNIKILSVYPGGMKTNFQKNAKVKIVKGEKFLSTSYVYNEIMKGLRKHKKILIIGAKSKVMYYASRLIPDFLLIKIYNSLMKRMR